MMRLPIRVRAVHPSTWSHYGVAMGLGLLALQLRVVVLPLDGGHPFATFYPVVVAACWFLGTGPAILVAVIGGLSGWYLLIPPLWSFELERDGQLALALYAIVCTLICVVAAAMREVPRRE